MQAVDFEYDNQYLSNYGFIICDFDFSDGVVTADTGSVISFKKISHNNGRKHTLVSSQYEDCITATFDICKDPAIYGESLEVSSEDYRSIARWLNRNEFCLFRPFDPCEDEHGLESFYYNASFNLSKVQVDGKTVGIRLSMETDSPFGYGAEVKEEVDFTGYNGTFTFDDTSDEIGYIYPEVEITLKANGNLTLSNEMEGCSSYIKNCKSGEVIKMHGDTNVITSSLASHDIANDFNYDFFRIGNTFRTRKNKITSSLPCHLKISYMPIVKDIL